MPKPQGSPALPKPPYELADRSGEGQFFKTIGAIGQNVFGKIIQAQAENEYHSFIGAAGERQQQFVNLINQRPDMPLSEMQGEIGKMVKDIRLYHSKLKLPQSRQSGANWIASNLGTLKERAEGEVAVVSTKYAQETAALLSDDIIRRVEEGVISPKQGKETIADLYGRHILSGIVREEFGTLKARAYINEINNIEVKQIHSAILDMAFNTKNEDGKRDIQSGDRIIENQPMSREEKTKLKKELREAVAQEAIYNNKAQEADRDTINNLMYKTLEFDKAIDAINVSSLDEKEQGIKMKEAIELQLAMAKGGKDVEQEKAKSDLLIKISNNPRKYDDAYISDEALAGRIHPSHLPQLKLWREKVVKGLTGTVASKKGYKLLEVYNKKGVFGKGADGANLYIETVNNFTEFLLEEDRSAKDVTEYIENMTPELGAWERFWAGFDPAEEKARAKKIRGLVDIETKRLEETKSAAMIDASKEPKTREEFIETANSITDPTNKRLYVDKWLGNF